MHHLHASRMSLASMAIALGALFIGISTKPAPPVLKAVSRPPIVGVSNIELNTGDLATARKFYTGTLGFQEPFSINAHDGKPLLLCFKVNDHQYIEILPQLKSSSADRLSHISFETTDAEQLREYLASRGVRVLMAIEPTLDGNRSFAVQDPDNHTVEFIQYMPGSLHSRNFGKFLPPGRISSHIIHLGIVVQSRAAADRFYKDILGFRETWQGGMTDTRTDWVDMRVPEGTDWLEYMLNVRSPAPQELGVMHHMALGVPNIQTAYRMVTARGLKPGKPKIGRNGKWQLNLYDPNLTRVELMEPKPVRKPCCSQMVQ